MALPRPHDDDGVWRWPITIGPEECVAVVAAAWGQRSLSRVAIEQYVAIYDRTAKASEAQKAIQEAVKAEGER